MFSSAGVGMPVDIHSSQNVPKNKGTVQEVTRYRIRGIKCRYRRYHTLHTLGTVPHAVRNSAGGGRVLYCGSIAFLWVSGPVLSFLWGSGYGFSPSWGSGSGSSFYGDLDPVYHFYEDPEATFQIDVDLDPQNCYYKNV